MKRLKKNNSRGFLLFVFFILIACLTALGLYYFIFKNKTAKTEVVETPQAVPTTDTIPPAADSTAKLQDSLAAQAAPVTTPKDSFNFKVVLKDYPDEAAVNKAFQKLTSYGHKLVIIKADSAKYQLAMPFTAPLGDSVKMRDSLKVFFGGRPYIITQ